MRNKITPYHFMLLLAFALTFSVVIRVGFATSDDYEYYYRYYNDADVWKSSLEYAKMNGRFYFVFMQPLFNIILPHVTGSLAFTNFLQALLVIAGAALFARNLSRLLQSEKAGYLFLVVYCAFISFKTTNNPVTAYPFYFSSAWIFFQLSVFYFIKGVGQNRKRYSLYSAGFYLVALLFYEMFLVYLPVYPLVYLLAARNKGDAGISVRIMAGSLRYHLALCGAYVLVYFIFKKWYSAQLYDGVNVSSSLDPSLTVYTLLRFIRGALPLHHYFSNVNVYQVSSDIPGGHVQSVLTPFVNMRVEWAVKAALLGVSMLYFAYWRKGPGQLNQRSWLLPALLCLLLILVPNLLISVTSKYQQLALLGADYYISTYFVVFPLYGLLAVLALGLNRIVNRAARRFAIAVCVTVVMFSSVLMDYANSYVRTDLGKIYTLFTSIDRLAEHPAFLSLAGRNDAVFSSKDLFETDAALSYYNAGAFDISHYFRAKLGREFRVARDSTGELPAPPGKDHYRISYRNYSSGSYFVFSGDSTTHLFVRSTRPEVQVLVSDSCEIRRLHYPLAGKKRLDHIEISGSHHAERIMVSDVY